MTDHTKSAATQPYRTTKAAQNAARLLAAAPDLLKIVRRVAEHFAATDAPLGLAAAAIIARIEHD